MLQEAIQFIRQLSESQLKKWLIIGKGPSADSLSKEKTSIYHCLTLNHAILNHTAVIAHFIDLDALLDCQDTLLIQAQYVALPWHPHINNQSTEKTLLDLCKEYPILAQLEQENRLITYNASTWQPADHIYPNGSIISVQYFSAEAAFQLLAQAGINIIYSAGIDGGNSYAKQFKSWEEKTLLSNQQSSFDLQFRNIAKTLWQYKVEHHLLNEQSPVRVFIATTAAQMLAVQVLEYSIKSNSSIAVEVVPLHQNNIKIPIPKDIKNHARTPFSFQRFIIPELCNFNGKAIYLDSDMLVFHDIRQLWTLPNQEHPVIAVGDNKNQNRKPQFSVMLMNCKKLDWDITNIIQELDQNTLTYAHLMEDMPICSSIGRTIPIEWNSLESFVPDQTSLLHYTDMPYQPWVSIWNPLGWIWCQALIKAVDDGFIELEEIEEHARLGFIRPSLVWQVKNRCFDSLTLPRNIIKMDIDFIPPYQGMSIYQKEYEQSFKPYTPKISKRFFLKLKAFFRKLKKEYTLS